MYECLQRDEKHWFVTIPHDSGLNAPRYPFRLESIVDGYYFNTLEGSVVVHDKDVGVKVDTKTVAQPVPTTDKQEPEEKTQPVPEPKQVEKEPEDTPVEEPKKEERSALDIANAIINKTKQHKKGSEANQKVADALAELRKKKESEHKAKEEEEERKRKEKEEAERIAEQIQEERKRKQQEALSAILKK